MVKNIVECEVAECQWTGNETAYRKHKSREHRHLIKQIPLEKDHFCICTATYVHASNLSRHMKTCTVIAEIKLKRDQENPNPQIILAKGTGDTLSYAVNGNVLFEWYWYFLKEWQLLRSTDRLFEVILMDPPWEGSGVPKYKLLTDDQIRKMPLDVVQKVGWIFVWVTNKKKYTAMKMLEEWGYEYYTTIVWEKSENEEKESWGMGYWTQHTHEDLLVARKGTTQVLQTFTDRHVIKNSCYANREKPQSRKPDKIYEMIEKMCPNTYKLEVFGRQHNIREGWTTFGLEVKQ